ncbi:MULTISPECIES: SemiSWEET transporter [unclassified Nostoc]|uniref:SemiSWEET family sugar transporter n=1 Tax=unclassified Nostoc TaxID=2593658 RepID=UPI002AD484DB|nr:MULTISPECIES: SemiSWEET transporter [unclassified Nostoc]MDZ7969306.1 SemiSWEET transporter [Nostoc sp. DedSLP03]MDZ8215684.1 SemiSWEET transporter [Nostoc sp. ChiSLP03a]
MEIDFTTILGLVAGVLTTLAYLPQLIKTWQSKSANDLSWSMLIILCVGIILWLIYGFSVHDIPLIAANIVTLLIASVILVLKIRYRSGTDEEGKKQEAQGRTETTSIKS